MACDDHYYKPEVLCGMSNQGLVDELCAAEEQSAALAASGPEAA